MEHIPRKFRPALKWHGGKTYLARRIVALFGPHRAYVEPFAGGLSVLLNKPPAEVEVAGDLDAGLINFYRALTADPGAFLARLRRLPYDAGTFTEAAGWLAGDDDRRRAEGFIVRNRFSRGGLGRDFAWSDRPRGKRHPDGPAPGDLNAWRTILDDLDAIADRLRLVRFVHGPAVDLIREYDGPDTLFYVDPPYVPSTRTDPGAYRHEMTAGQHEELIAALVRCRGAVVLSGYRSPLYDAALAGWGRSEWDMPNHSGQGKAKQRRTECVWVNPAATR